MIWTEIQQKYNPHPSLFLSLLISNRKRVSRSSDATRRSRWPIYRQKCRFNSHRYSLSSITPVDKRARYVRDLSLMSSFFVFNKRQSLKVINRHAGSARSRTRIYRRKWPPRFPSPWVGFIIWATHAEKEHSCRLPRNGL